MEVQAGEGMGFTRAWAQTGRLEQVLADQMRQAAFLLAEAQVDAGLAEGDGQQLRMAVGHVQQAEGAKALEGWGGVIGLGGLRMGHAGCKAGHRGGPQHLQQFAPAGIHCALTGDLGSSSRAMMSRICPSLSTPAWPKRGMPEQAL